jgi:hypothetical protein
MRSQNFDANFAWRSLTRSLCKRRFSRSYDDGILGIPAMLLACNLGRNYRIITAFPRLDLLKAFLRLNLLEVFKKDS